MERKKKLKAKIIYEGKTRKNTHAIPIIIAVLVIAILAVGFLSQWTFFIQNKDVSDSVLVSINGAEITQLQLNEQWDALPIVAQMQITKDQLLKELIQETLLLQEAKKQNIVVSEEEVNQFINLRLSQMGMTYDQFEKALAAQGTSPEDMKEIYKKQLTVAKLLDTTINNTLNATTEEIEAYYKKNKENFHRDPQVKVRHILIAVDNKTLNESQAQERVDTVLAKLESDNNQNFCELVKEYSSDFGSVSNCGEYTFGRGQMVQEFEDAAYDMKVGEVRVARSQYGFHIIIKDADIPEKYLSLNDTVNENSNQTVAQGIKQAIVESKAQKVFDSYVKKLTEKSKITYFNPIDENLSKNDSNITEVISDLTTNQKKDVNNDLTDNESSEITKNLSLVENNQTIPAES